MGDDYSSRSDSKRKFDDPSGGAAPARRQTGFSAPIATDDVVEIAKQRAQEIAAKLFSESGAKRPRVENGADDSAAAADDLQKPLPSHSGLSSQPSFPSYGYPGANKKIEIPNGRVGVIIGKGGETIKYLQLQSGAKIQVTRDADADPNSLTRLVELIGTSEQVSRAEQLINEVLAEADTGGSGIVSSRKFGAPQTGAEQFQMQIPNNKVGLIIGKGGETIKNMQARSGARIQVIPLHLPPGDTSAERTLYIDGTSEQIESAKQLVNEVISENRVRNPSMAGGYPQQGYRPPRPPTNWGPPGVPPTQPGYGYMQPGAYPGPPPQYNASQPPYGAYPPASGAYLSGWDQTTSQPAQPGAPGSGYDYYNQQPPQQQPPVAGSAAPADTTGYNYGQPPPSYGQGSYGDSAYSQSSVGQMQGYAQDPYSGGYHAQSAQPGYTQPASNPQAGYDNQGYGSTPGYGTMSTPSQDGSASAYGTQGATSQTPPAQQPAASQPPAAQGYAGQPPVTTSASYPTQGSAPSGYGSQTPSQTAYGQTAPPTQTGFGQPQAQKPPAPAVYGQGQPPATTPPGYMQPAPVQPGYGQPHQSQSGYAQDSSYRVPPSGYTQQQSYGAATQTQPSYAQQQQPYGDYSGAGVYTQTQGYSGDNASHGTYDASATTPTAQSGATKASPS